MDRKKKNYNNIKYVTIKEHTKNHMNKVDEITTAYDLEKVVQKIKELSIRERGEIKTEDVIAIVKSGETGITADKNFAREVANFTEKHLKNDLIRIAEENWTDSQVKMLKGLICAAVNGIEYSDAYEAVNKD